jgi:alanyl-tRNA synthetase
LLTEVWNLPKDRLWATYFKDELDEIPEDREAAEIWLDQPGFNPDHLLPFGRKENFWEMADIGPCGPDTEIHFDRGPKFCDKSDDPDHICRVNGDCERFLEIWNNVFIQYNRLSESELVPLEKTHVDTGMGFERIVSILQDVPSNYKTDLFMPLIQRVQELTGQSDEEREADLTPYRVIADHARATAFLIADGVVPGNIGRNYICRMLVRRAARFGMKLDLHEPFMAKVAQVVIDNYGDFYSELKRNEKAILDSLTREEEQFQKTVKAGLEQLDELLAEIKKKGKKVLDGGKAFELYATHGLPLEITQDIAEEQGLKVDSVGFTQAMEAHRLASGAGQEFGEMGAEDVEVYTKLSEELKNSGKLDTAGVAYTPYQAVKDPVEILALIKDGEAVDGVETGDQVEVLLPKTWFYVESGGQVSDTGQIVSADGKDWIIRVTDMRKPAAGVIVHVGEVVQGQPKKGDLALAQVDEDRRIQIMRNHTATHLLHAALHKVLGKHARQAGSLVAPDRLRFDFNHPKPMTREEILAVEAEVNHAILANYPLQVAEKPLQSAIDEGAMALFGEKYEAEVRTISIGDEERLSYELCGGTHVDETGDIGLFLITYEGSIASGVRRIEAVTGWRAYQLARERMNIVDDLSSVMSTPINDLKKQIVNQQENLKLLKQENSNLRTDLYYRNIVESESTLFDNNETYDLPFNLQTKFIKNADRDSLISSTDLFREQNTSGSIVLGSTDKNGKPFIIVAVTEDLVDEGLDASEIIKTLSKKLGGGGGGTPTLAQGGGKDASKLKETIEEAPELIKKMYKDEKTDKENNN